MKKKVIIISSLVIIIILLIIGITIKNRTNKSEDSTDIIQEEAGINNENKIEKIKQKTQKNRKT